MKNLFILLAIGLFGCSTTSDMACCESKKECSIVTTCCDMDHCDKDKCEANDRDWETIR